MHGEQTRGLCKFDISQFQQCKREIHRFVVMGAMLSTFGRSEPPETFIRRLISEHCVVVFAKTHCPYSQMAKDIFAMLEVPVKTVDIDLRSDGESIQDTLKIMTKARTVRQTRWNRPVGLQQ